MRTYILKRILGVVPTVLMITLVVFVMMRSVPGDPVVPLLGDAYTEEDAIKVREAYGLNKPVLVQYGEWLGRAVQANLGRSVRTNQPVVEAVGQRLKPTLQLSALALLISLCVAIPGADVSRANARWRSVCWPTRATASAVRSSIRRVVRYSRQIPRHLRCNDCWWSPREVRT